MAKAVEPVKGGNVPAHIGGFEEFAGAGMENVGINDILVPRLTILQDLSPQLKERKSEFIEGAKIGDICDVGTNEIYRDGVLFLPVHYRKDYLEWAPRASGKGLVNVHSDPAILDQCSRNEKNQPILGNGNYIAETAQFFGLNLTAGRRKCFIPMTSTQLRKARRWMTLATGEKLKRGDGSEFVAPLFYRTYNLTTAEESNNEGEWMAWVIQRGAALPELDIGTNWETIKDEAVSFREALISGEARADVGSMDEHDANQGGTGGSDGAM